MFNIIITRKILIKTATDTITICKAKIKKTAHTGVSKNVLELELLFTADGNVKR